MIFDRKLFGFGVKMAKGCHLQDPKADLKGLVLDSLRFKDIGIRKI